MRKKIKYNLLIIEVFLGLGIIISACSELDDPLPTVTDLTIHKDGILDPDSPDFHGLLVSQSVHGLEDCQQCHASNFSRGITPNGCNLPECHTAIDVHQEGINDPGSQEFHGNFIAVNGWEDCKQCHGLDFTGGIATVGCNIPNCHPAINVHQDGITDPVSPEFHGKFIAAIGWDLAQCSQCHSSDYAGGIVAPSCLNCHTQTGGPEACNTCHGNFNDPAFIAPPQDTKNNTSTDSAGVGAHNAHLYENDLGSQIECSTCHDVPQNYSDPGHVDTPPPAEVIFGNIAIINIAVNADYDHSSATCSDTYCHGNIEYLKDAAPDNHKFAFEDGADRMIGNNRSVIWNNVDGSQALCGSCHNLPPVGHVQANITGCGTCHSGIFDRDGNLVDSLSYKHINGEIDLIF